MAKRRNGRRLKPTIPLTIVAGVAAGLTSSVVTYSPIQCLQTGDFQNLLRGVAANYTGYDPGQQKWSFEYLKAGFGPLVIAMVVHKAASMIGLNSALAKAGIPYLRV